jgi:hypothetical protein
MEVRPERLEPELERRRDAEVPARAAEAPEELGLLRFGRADEAAICRDELDGARLSIVSPKLRCSRPTPPPSVSPATPVWPMTPIGQTRPWAWAATSSSPSSAPPFARAVRVRGSAATPRIADMSTRSRRSSPEARRAVAAGSDRDLEVVVARKAHRRRDLLGARRAGDDRRPPIVDRVPQPARVVVAGVLGQDHLGARTAQLIDVARCDPRACLDHSRPSRSDVLFAGLVDPEHVSRWIGEREPAPTGILVKLDFDPTAGSQHARQRGVGIVGPHERQDATAARRRRDRVQPAELLAGRLGSLIPAYSPP